MRMPGILSLFVALSAALLIGAVSTPAHAEYETVGLINETTDAFTLSVNGGAPCNASPRDACIRSARTGANALEACSSKECLRKTVELKDREILRWTISERAGKYSDSEERRMQR
jgi:hypothetical protein